ncbi:MAG TPA: glycosyl hydrolase 115 family protein, partial [Terriglobia bacterium]|nr:glycosyl hydrolase 115 family protein [Terriglobia bacterium]
MIRRLLILICLLEAFCAVAPARIAVNERTTVFVDAREPTPIQLAAKDLASDLGNVFGRPARIVHRPSEASPVVIWVAFTGDLPQGVEKPAGWEKLSIQAVNNPWPGSGAQQAIVLTGSDVRGTIYAVYEFAERYLGVDPLYYWTDHQPTRRASIELPASLSETLAGPVFKYRGFFINDEDLLTGWAPGEKNDHTGISLEVWNKIYETILRLKGNIVAPGTWIFPNDPQIKLAGERGLIVTQHHAIPLGLNVARWPKDVPYNFSTHPEILERAWKNAVAAYPSGQEVLWTVGLRGLSDVSYASMDPSVRGNNQALGRLISKAIADQMRIVREGHPDAQFITALWREGAKLAQQGDLTIPPEVSRVWGDDGYGYLQDKGAVTKGEGAYYHVAVMNFRANQLSEMVPVGRIYSELGRYIQAGATNYLLVNTSDIRPVPLTIKAIMEAAWKGVPAGGADASHEFIRRWAADEFGPRAASQVAEVYEDYF